MYPVELNGENLSIEDVYRIASSWEEPTKVPVIIGPEAIDRVNRARQAIENFISNNEIIYGVTTGFGDFKDRIIPLHQIKELQRNIILSHATGVGPALPRRAVRAMMAVRVQTFLKGHSGIRLEVIERLLQMVNSGVYPIIPVQGSLGASGDLAPLAHMSLVLIGEGEAWYQDKIYPAAEAMALAGIPIVVLEAKEGLALTNGTTLMSTLGALSMYKAEQLTRIADIAAALSIEALQGTPLAFDERLHHARPHPGQIASAAYIRKLLEDSNLVRVFDPLDIQDAYSLRCTPQVHGAARDVCAFARGAIEIELNSANDNPLIFYEDDGTAVAISGGNFHGEPIAIPMDNLKVGLAELANISERRLTRLIDYKTNKNILPPFLTRHGGVNSGFMIVQYTAASLVSENKVLAHPASVDSIPSSANTEDHVSMGTIAARQVYDISKNVEYVLACELFGAAQGIDFRLENGGEISRLGKGTRAAYQLIRDHVPFLETDALMAPLIKKVHNLVLSGELLEIVEEEII
jgi:histidine ammonia-lyase